CDEVPGCRQWRTLKARPDTCSINKIDLRILPELQLVEASDLLQEIERPVIAAHKKMLAVVHLTTRGSIGKGIGTPPKETSGFEQQALSSLRAEFYGRRKACEAATNNCCRKGFAGHRRMER